MKGAIQSPYSNDQIAAWLRGLLTVAWADGNFDAKEQELIANITDTELAPKIKFESLEPIEPEELAAVLGKNTTAAENFLRTAVMVAIADGIYSPTEDDLLHKLCLVLGQPEELLKALRYTIEHPQQIQTPSADLTKRQLDGLRSIREWLDKLEIHDPTLARFLCKMIPSQCPFERDVKLFGRKIVHIPPMCKINPLYEQLVGLRFRALSYLADDCGEDVSPYI
ncbi:MAG: nitrogenase [Tolypothrix brevis GSE-NOS-MK-07-07A]|nr:nitrogenase [Tolypothrix brevis GSE-NOS-MK-07-07A]